MDWVLPLVLKQSVIRPILKKALPGFHWVITGQSWISYFGGGDRSGGGVSNPEGGSGLSAWDQALGQTWWMTFAGDWRGVCALLVSAGPLSSFQYHQPWCPSRLIGGWFCSYLVNRSHVVVLGDAFSTRWPLRCEVQQGTILSLHETIGKSPRYSEKGLISMLFIFPADTKVPAHLLEHCLEVVELAGPHYLWGFLSWNPHGQGKPWLVLALSPSEPTIGAVLQFGLKGFLRPARLCMGLCRSQKAA